MTAVRATQRSRSATTAAVSSPRDASSPGRERPEVAVKRKSKSPAPHTTTTPTKAHHKAPFGLCNNTPPYDNAGVDAGYKGGDAGAPPPPAAATTRPPPSPPPPSEAEGQGGTSGWRGEDVVVSADALLPVVLPSSLTAGALESW